MDFLEAIKQATGVDLTFLNDTFARVEIAEPLVDEYARRAHEQGDPDRRDLLYGSFMTLNTKYPMPLELYRRHCVELLDRIAEGRVTRKKINRATEPEVWAEILHSIKNASLKVPLDSRAVALYGFLFKQIYPVQAAGLGEALEMIREPYDGSNDALIADLVNSKQLMVDREQPKPRMPVWVEGEGEVMENAPVQMMLFE